MKRQFRKFDEAKKYVHSLELKSKTEWRNYYRSSKKPSDIPSGPEQVYQNEWKNWGDWLGTDNIRQRDRTYLSFIDAQKWAKSSGIISSKKWYNSFRNKKIPKNIPRNPNLVYKKDWKGWGDFLGTGKVADQLKEYRSFDDAREFVRNLGLKGWDDWHRFCKSGKKPDDIPSHPWNTYSKEVSKK